MKFVQHEDIQTNYQKAISNNQEQKPPKMFGFIPVIRKYFCCSLQTAIMFFSVMSLIFAVGFAIIGFTSLILLFQQIYGWKIQMFLFRIIICIVELIINGLCSFFGFKSRNNQQYARRLLYLNYALYWVGVIYFGIALFIEGFEQEYHLIFILLAILAFSTYSLLAVFSYYHLKKYIFEDITISQSNHQNIPMQIVYGSPIQDNQMQNMNLDSQQTNQENIKNVYSFNEK